MNHFEVPDEPHKQLNPALWDGDELKPAVARALMRLANEYRKFLGIDVEIQDIIVSGSQANYTYSEHSDLDLHLIVRYSDIACDLPVHDLLKTKRDLWREEHDISIYGIPVEIYVEDTEEPAVSASYSLLNNRWITEPKVSKYSGKPKDIERVVLAWMKVITAALRSGDLAQMTRVKSLLWSYRKSGLARTGELGPQNVAFKTLRNSGVTDSLLTAIHTLQDRELSLEHSTNL